MFIPAEQVIIALEDSKTTTMVFKDFQANTPNDKFEMCQMNIGNRFFEVIHSDNFYKYFCQYLDTKLEEYEANNLKTFFDKHGKIKFFYVTPKELLNIMPSSNISFSLYNKAYCLMFLSSTNDIIILLQAINPITAIDENLFNIILGYIVKGCIRYVFGCNDILDKNVKEKTIFSEYHKFTDEWYTNFVTILVNKYNMLKDNNSDDKEIKELKLRKLKNDLISVVREGDKSSKGIVPKESLITFFTYTMLNHTDITDVSEERSTEHDLVKIKTIGIDPNKEMLKKYLEEILNPLKTILNNNVFQPDVLMTNQEYSVWMEIIKETYAKTLNNIIDPIHMIKHTMFQEMYHYYVIAENYSTYRNEETAILKLLAKGEIFEF